MQQQTNPQRFFVAGQAVELWENPLLPFGCALNDLESYCLNARWDLLFNAIVNQYGIPGVVGTRKATERIADGVRVRVDGDAGEVTVLG